MENQEALIERLDNSESFSDMFEIVEEVVKETFNAHRAGLMLGLAEMGARGNYFIGAFYPVGSNIIVLNKTPLRRIRENHDSQVYKSYCFHLLLHEYLHSLGVLNERLVRRMTYQVSFKSFGSDHPATEIAKKGIGSLFPFVTYPTPDYPFEPDREIEIVSGFDRRNTMYFS